MIDKFKVFNKIKVDTKGYMEVDSNNEKLKVIMSERLKSSKRVSKKIKTRKTLISSAASIAILVVGIGVVSPSLADNIVRRLPEFETMLDKIKGSIDKEDTSLEYNPKNYPEIEKEKREYKKNRLVATSIGVSSYSEGLSITIDKAMYDRKKLYIEMILKTDKPFKESEVSKAVFNSVYGDDQKNMYIDISNPYINDVSMDGYAYGPGIVEYIDEHTVRFSQLLELDQNNDIEKAKFEFDLGIHGYTDKNCNSRKDVKGKWHFKFNIKAIDDGKKHIDLNKKDGDYTLKYIDVTNTYIQLKLELPFQPSLGNPHNNFILVYDENGREIEMSSGVEGANKIYTQMNNLNGIGEIPKYIDILVYDKYPVEEEGTKPISRFRVDIK